MPSGNILSRISSQQSIAFSSARTCARRQWVDSSRDGYFSFDEGRLDVSHLIQEILSLASADHQDSALRSERKVRSIAMDDKRVLKEEDNDMSPFLFQFLLFAIGASKMAFLLAFFCWMETRKEQPQAQAMGYHV